MSYKVGEVASLAGISVRTLHHYDEIGLLEPSLRTGSGYRLYSDSDLDVLQQILLLRELDFGLGEIAEMLTDPAYDRLEALVSQRALVGERIERANRLIEHIDKAIAATEGAVMLTNDEKFEVFGDFDPDQYEDEVKERWGDTDAYKESARRTKRYTKQDWEAVKADSQAAVDAFVAAMEAGLPADDPAATYAAELHRLSIDKWFYPLSHDMQANLAEMYIADARFAKHYEDIKPGLAQYVHDAIIAGARKAGAR